MNTKEEVIAALKAGNKVRNITYWREGSFIFINKKGEIEDEDEDILSDTSEDYFDVFDEDEEWIIVDGSVQFPLFN